jgi:proteic killer suppression protein
MIKSFRDKETEAIFKGEPVLKFQNIANVARRKLRSIHQARTLRDLSQLPGNQLEALKHDRIGQHSVRINDQYRVCFVWEKGDARDVEIVDYH